MANPALEILKEVKNQFQSYKDYWDLSKEDKITLEKETIALIKSGKFGEIGKKTLGERIKNLKIKKSKKVC